MSKFSNFKDDANAKKYSLGTVIFEQGEPGDVMYIVVEGEIEIRLKSNTINTIGADEIFGEMALLDESPRSASAYAISDCTLVSIDQTRFKTLIREDPDFALQVMRVMSDRLRKVTKLSIIEKLRNLNPAILQQLYPEE